MLVDKQFYPIPKAPLVGSKVKYLNLTITKSNVHIFTECFVCRQTNNNMKHIRWDFSLNGLGRIGCVDLGCVAEAKIKLFQNMVMLHIKLKGTTHTVTC